MVIQIQQLQVLTIVHKKSTLREMRETEGKPKSVIAKVYKNVGGVLEAASKSELPRNRRQVYNMQHSSASCATAGKADPIFELIQQCKIDHMPGGRKFIRSVNFENSSSCVITTDSQLTNVAKFCSIPSSLHRWLFFCKP